MNHKVLIPRNNLKLQPIACVFQLLCLISIAKLDPTIDLDHYLQTLSMLQIILNF